MGSVLLPRVQFFLTGFLCLWQLSEVCVQRGSTNTHCTLYLRGLSSGMYLPPMPGSYTNSIVPRVACGVTVCAPPCWHLVSSSAAFTLGREAGVISWVVTASQGLFHSLSATGHPVWPSGDKCQGQGIS